jgi:hypothetical protein
MSLQGRSYPVSTSALLGPLRRFAVQLDELRSGDVPDMEQVGIASVRGVETHQRWNAVRQQVLHGSRRSHRQIRAGLRNAN